MIDRALNAIRNLQRLAHRLEKKAEEKLSLEMYRKIERTGEGYFKEGTPIIKGNSFPLKDDVVPKLDEMPEESYYWYAKK